MFLQVPMVAMMKGTTAVPRTWQRGQDGGRHAVHQRPAQEQHHEVLREALQQQAHAHDGEHSLNDVLGVESGQKQRDGNGEQRLQNPGAGGQPAGLTHSEGQLGLNVRHHDTDGEIRQVDHYVADPNDRYDDPCACANFFFAHHSEPPFRIVFLFPFCR